MRGPDAELRPHRLPSAEPDPCRLPIALRFLLMTGVSMTVRLPTILLPGILAGCPTQEQRKMPRRGSLGIDGCSRVR